MCNNESCCNECTCVGGLSLDEQYVNLINATIKNKNINNVLLGLAGEVGEIIEPYKKHLYQNQPKPNDKDTLYEIGDLLYYLRLLLMSIDADVTLDDVIRMNIDKLTKRHNVGLAVSEGE